MEQNQSTQLEEVVSSTIQGLRLLEDKLGYEFAEAIDTIERLYDLQTAPVQAMNEYAELSGKGEAAKIVAANQGNEYKLPGDKTVSAFFDSMDAMFAPLHSNKEVF